MAFDDLARHRHSPTEGPTKTDVLEAETFTIGIVSLDAGQEIDPHPEPYEVFFFVLDGAGEFATGEGRVELRNGDALYLESGERRGIRCTEPLTIVGMQEAH